MKRFKNGDVVRIIESGKIGVVVSGADYLPCDYEVDVNKSYLHGYDELELSPATKLDYLLLGLDSPDNAVYNKPEVNND